MPFRASIGTAPLTTASALQATREKCQVLRCCFAFASAARP